MKIVFYPVFCRPFHGKTLEERPLGGTESAVILLAEALSALGHEVAVVTCDKHPPLTKPAYIHQKELYEMTGVDAVIVVRGWEGVFHPFKARQRLFWTGDTAGHRLTYGIGDKRFARQVGGLLAVSTWQANDLCEASGFPRDQVFVLRNGVKLSNFDGAEGRRRKRLIYSSTPDRGLRHLAPIYRVLKEKHADLELYVYSSLDRYSKEWPPAPSPDKEYHQIFEELGRLAGVHLHGSIAQSMLAREFMKASILAYPCDYPETSCMTAMEAQAAGCVAVTSDLGAMSETIGGGGILITGKAGSAEYQAKFIAAVDRLLSDDDYYSDFSRRAKEGAQGLDWKLRAEDLINYIDLPQ